MVAYEFACLLISHCVFMFLESLSEGILQACIFFSLESVSICFFQMHQGTTNPGLLKTKFSEYSFSGHMQHKFRHQTLTMESL